MNYDLGSYGVLNNAFISERYSSGEIEGFKVDEESKIYINNYVLIPSYTIGDSRKRESSSITLYKTGEIKSIYLEKSTAIDVGGYSFNVEKIIFYKSGKVKKIFPLDGKITAYWTEDDEYNTAEVYNFNVNHINYSGKLISMKFYEDEKIKSITMWPKDRISIEHNNLLIENRIGLSFYPNGNLMTCEPSKPIYISTPIGKIKSYDINSIGIHGEDNSLKFNEDGTIKALKTSTDVIVAVNNNSGCLKVHEPKLVTPYSNSDLKELITVDIEFCGNNVIINEEYVYNLKEYYFIIKNK